MSKNTNIQNNKIFLYKGFDKNKVVNNSIIGEIKKILPQFEFFSSDDISFDLLDKYLPHSFCIVLLTESNPEINKKFLSHNIPRIENFNDANDICIQIRKIFSRIISKNTILIISEDYPGYGGFGTYAYYLYKKIKNYDCKLLYLLSDKNHEKKILDLNDPNIIPFFILDYYAEIKKLFVRDINNINNKLKSLFLLKNINEINTVITITPIAIGIAEMFTKYKKHYYISGSFHFDINKIIKNNYDVWNIGKKLFSELIDDHYYTDIFAEFYKNDLIEILPNSPLAEELEKKIVGKYCCNNKVHKYYFGLFQNIFEKNKVNKIYDIIFVSPIIERKEKNFELVKKIYTLLPNLSKVIIGKNSSKYESLFKNITCIELTDTETVKEYLSKTKILLQPSYLDIGPITFIESIFSYCIPLIHNNVGFSTLYKKNRILAPFVFNNFDLKNWILKINYALDNFNLIVDQYYELFSFLFEEINRSQNDFYNNVLSPLEIKNNEKREFSILVYKNGTYVNNHYTIYPKYNIDTVSNADTFYKLMGKNVNIIPIDSHFNNVGVKLNKYVILTKSSIMPFTWEKIDELYDSISKYINKFTHMKKYLNNEVMIIPSLNNYTTLNNVVLAESKFFLNNLEFFNNIYYKKINIPKNIINKFGNVYYSKQAFGFDLNKKIDLCILVCQQFENNIFDLYCNEIGKQLNALGKNVSLYLAGLPFSKPIDNIHYSDIVVKDISLFFKYICDNEIKKIFIPYFHFMYYPKKYRDELFANTKNLGIDVYIYVAGFITPMHEYCIHYKITKVLCIGSAYKELYEKHKINTLTYCSYFYPYKKNINEYKLFNYSDKVPRKTFCYAGRLSSEKRINFIIDCFELFLNKTKDYEYKLYLLCNTDEALLNYVKSKSVKNNIICKDWMEQDELLNFINEKIDYNIMASVCEGIPGIMLETMRMGVPTISSNIYCVNEVIHNNYNGILFDYHNYKEYAFQKIYLFADDLIDKIKIHDAINSENLVNALLKVHNNTILLNNLSKNCINYYNFTYTKLNNFSALDFFDL